MTRENARMTRENARAAVREQPMARARTQTPPNVLFITDKTKFLKSALGQRRRFHRIRYTSGYRLISDIGRAGRYAGYSICSRLCRRFQIRPLLLTPNLMGAADCETYL
jgi:hypothetical protein